MIFTLGALVSVTVADSVYRCSDWTFTNRADRNCAPHNTQAIGRVQPANGRTMEEGKPSVAEVKLYRGTARDSIRAKPTRQLGQADLKDADSRPFRNPIGNTIIKLA